MNKVRGTAANKERCSVGPHTYKQGELVGNAKGESRLGYMKCLSSGCREEGTKKIVELYIQTCRKSNKSDRSMEK